MQAQQHQQQHHQQQQPLRAFPVPIGRLPPNLIDAVIVSDGYFQRCSSGGNNFGFEYHSVGSVSVEANVNVTRRHRSDNAQYHLFPWLLNLKSFLWLQPTTKDTPGAFGTMAVRNYLRDNCFTVFAGRQYIEYGFHLFVATDNILHAVKLYRYRPNHPLEAKEITSISDIVPKARVFKRSRSNPPQYDYCVIKSVIVVENTVRISDDIFARWWYRFGREQVTRFIECGNFDHNWDRYIDIRRTQSYFGLYVHDRAKLILTDEVEDPTTRAVEHNRTLVLGGVFVIINGFIEYEFYHHMPQTDKVNTARFIVLYNQFNIAAARITGRINHPVIMLCPLPSKSESLCWSASMSIKNNVLMAKLEVPSFGLCRLSMYEWADGLAQVRREQAVHHYHQNVRIPGVSQPIPRTDIRVTHLHANDQRELTLVRSDDPALFRNN